MRPPEGCSRVMSPYRPPNAFLPTANGPGSFVVPAHAPAPFQFADFIRLLDARRVLILRVALATVLLGLAVALVLPTVYASSTVVMLDPRKNNVTDLSAVLSPLGNDPASVQNQIQILTSRDLAGNVVDRLKLIDDPEFNPALGRPSMTKLLGDLLSLLNPRNRFEGEASATAGLLRERVIDNFQQHVSADAQGLSTAITITATSRDAAKAARLADSVADAYLKSQIATKVSATNATAGWLNTRLHDLAQQLQVQEEAVQRYKSEHNLNDASPGNSILDQQMVGISAQVVQARSDLAEKQAINDRINRLVASGNPADVTQIVSSPLIVQLRGQEAALLAQEGDLTSRYGPLHPKMQAIEEQKRDLDFKIAQEVNRLAASAGNDVMTAKAHLASLEASLGGTEGTARSQNMARVELQAMESNAQSTRSMYEAFVQRLRQAQGQDDVQIPESRIISSAAVPLNPAAPRRGLIVAASIPLGLLLGVLAALLAEKFAPMMPAGVNDAARGAFVPPMTRTGHAQGFAAARDEPPILGEIDDPAQLRAADFVLDYPASKYSDAIAGLVLQLQAGPESGAAILALTSAENGESRSAIAVSLTRAASRMGKKAVLVDCAPERLASRAIKAPVKTGLYDVLTGAVTLNQALAKDPRSEAFVLATPRRPANSATMFASRPMQRLISVLRDGAEFVVIDCGTVSAEAGAVARLADATILVVKGWMVHSSLTAKATNSLRGANAAPIGIVTTR
jgi:succinoglycan biosynthesis transport protein ExoP